MLNTTNSYQMLTANLTQSLDNTANDPVVARETKYFRHNIGTVPGISTNALIGLRGQTLGGR